MGQAKLRATGRCYLCGEHLAAPINVDHVPPKLFFPEELRKGLNLLTIPTHVACNEAWRMDEEYFVHTLLPFARETQSGDAAIRQSFRKYRDGGNVPLVNMVMDEFKHVVGGVHLPANRVAKMIDSNRFHDVLYKIIRGLHFHHTGEILAPHWSLTYTVTAPRETPPDFFVAYAESGRGLSRGKYPSIFAYVFDKFPDVNDLHFWAFLLWDNIIVTALFHDMSCGCDYCAFVGPRLPESMPGTVRGI
jgi:hypothetical protein